MENYVGKRLDGRYEVQEIIGVGGMAVVYKAYDSIDDRTVSIKVLKDEFLANEEFKRRFKNESKAIAVLSHPNIVKVYDVHFGDKLQYIVMEYVDGITLKEYIQKQGTITWNDAVYFTSQILRALQHAHDRGIVHRDIKPQNIMLLPNGQIKVADFGIARFSRSETRTMTENAIGSVHYISPEQAKGEFTDERADIYSVGVVLYEMLAGKVPFEAESAVSVALMQLQNEAKRLTDINPDIPLGLEQITVHAMQKNPSSRYQTATEMLLDIEEIIKNPKVTFDYSYFVDKEPTRYVIKTDKIQNNEVSQENDTQIQNTNNNNNKKKIIAAVVTGSVVLFAAIVLIILYFTGSLNTDTRKLENFVGQSYDEIVESKQYPYEFIMEQQESNSAEPGTVISQKPDAGERVIANSTVKLIVAASEKSLTVPAMYGKEKEKAEQILKNAGITNYKFVSVESNNVKNNCVVYSDPKETSKISSSTTVTVFISSGPATTESERKVLPDVYGLSQANAKDVLTKAGFLNIEFITEDSEYPKNQVIEQSPIGGSSINPKDTVTIKISSGVPPTSAPSEYNIKIIVELPKKFLKDTLVIYVDGVQYDSKDVVLNGSSATMGISVENGKEVTIKAELVNNSIVSSKKIISDSEKSVTLSLTNA